MAQLADEEVIFKPQDLRQYLDDYGAMLGA
jgi:hypothetical protein